MISNELVYHLAIKTAINLSNQHSSLICIDWTDGESNLDSGFSQLACVCCEQAWASIIQEEHPEFGHIQIECSSPDINCVFTESDSVVFRSKIELKSSISNSIPGSTINKLDVNQPVIFCLRPQNKHGSFSFRSSQYHVAMGESDLDVFQDRTPRPRINFDKMPELHNYAPYISVPKSKWIDHYACCAVNRLSSDCRPSWQDELILKVQRITIQHFIDSTSTDQFAALKNANIH